MLLLFVSEIIDVKSVTQPTEATSLRCAVRCVGVYGAPDYLVPGIVSVQSKQFIGAQLSNDHQAAV